MPKNCKKKKNGAGTSQQSKPLILAEEEQTYGLVNKALGDRHFTVNCQDGQERLCHVRGKMKNRQFVKEGDIVLVTLRDFQDKNGDIIDIYTNDNIRSLRKSGDLTIGIKCNTHDSMLSNNMDNNEDDIIFEDI